MSNAIVLYNTEKKIEFTVFKSKTSVKSPDSESWHIMNLKK